jgi:hypothetical protein
MRKTILAFAFILLHIAAFSQTVRKEVLNPDHAGKIFRNPAKGKNRPQGSPYMQQMFASANVESLSIKANMRYNAFNDEFEFVSQKGDTLVLDKIEDFNNIFFSGLNKRYKLAQYTDAKGKLFYGYLIDVYQKGNYGVLKKENISFVEEKVAKTTLEVNMPAKYVKSGDTFYLKKDTVISEFPETKKQLVKLFPEKKEQLEAFVKENKISFSEDSDRIKIVNFLATL